MRNAYLRVRYFCRTEVPHYTYYVIPDLIGNPEFKELDSRFRGSDIT
ncbi:MAG: hypothetical protein L7F78_15715 [Syntrophales bacterium LBB04]|nr:hypothetical protein [Syntrophales bacterium LBB04]